MNLSRVIYINAVDQGESVKCSFDGPHKFGAPHYLRHKGQLFCQRQLFLRVVIRLRSIRQPQTCWSHQRTARLWRASPCTTASCQNRTTRRHKKQSKSEIISLIHLGMNGVHCSVSPEYHSATLLCFDREKVAKRCSRSVENKLCSSCFFLIAISEQMVGRKAVNHRVSRSHRAKHKLLSTTIQEFWRRESRSHKKLCVPLRRLPQNGEHAYVCTCTHSSGRTQSKWPVRGENAQLCWILPELSRIVTVKKSPSEASENKSGFIKRERKRQASQTDETVY